jgi:CheY-like chemotaxis protein
VTPAQRRLFDLTEERGRRTELLAALTRAGGLEPRNAANVLRVELRDLETAATAASLDGLAAMARATREVVEHLGGLRIEHWRQRDVLVLDDNEVTRDLLALALEAEGHTVRIAADLEQLSMLVRERKPHIVITEARMPGAPDDQFCNFLRRLMQIDSIPIVIFSSAQGGELATLALNAGADLWLAKDQGIGDLIRELTRLFEEILW